MTEFEGLQWVLSARDSDLRLTQVDLRSHANVDSSERIYVDRTQRFQEFLGFGGSFTEASAIALSRLSADKRREVLQAFFVPIEVMAIPLQEPTSTVVTSAQGIGIMWMKVTKAFPHSPSSGMRRSFFP